MRILGYDEGVQCYRAEWTRRHPATEPPSLYPEVPEDPNWVEASPIMDECWTRTRLGIGFSATEAAEFRAPEWTSGPGIIGCPNGHGFSMEYAYCPECGLGPMEAASENGTDVSSRQSLRRRGQHAWTAAERSPTLAPAGVERSTRSSPAGGVPRLRSPACLQRSRIPSAPTSSTTWPAASPRSRNTSTHAVSRAERWLSSVNWSSRPASS